MKKATVVHRIINFLLLLTLLFACNSKDPIIDYLPPSENPAFLKGKWVEEKYKNYIGLGGTHYIIEFTEDEFLLKFRYWTDIITSDDCRNPYTAYFRGFTEVTEDSIRLSGIATDESFVAKKAKCDRYATFQKSFKYELKSDTVLIFKPDLIIYDQIRLVKE